MAANPCRIRGGYIPVAHSQDSPTEQRLMESLNRSFGVLPRYDCHACREDADNVIGGRAHARVRELYEVHLRLCRECRRFHRVLHAVYEGPGEPIRREQPRLDHEFVRVLHRAKREQQQQPSWYAQLSVRTALVGLSACAVVLLLALFDVRPAALSLSLPLDELEVSSADRLTHEVVGSYESTRGIDHPAQSYGRIVAGSGELQQPDRQPVTTSTFPVGSRFSVGLGEWLQVGLAGKIVANFTEGTEVVWTSASPRLIELQHNRGMIAVRYDRSPSDPVLHIRTPSAIVRVVGTVFTVQVESDGHTIVSVLRGEVEVLEPKSYRLLAEVEAGYRFDVRQSTFADVGKLEVEAALPLSMEGPNEGESVPAGPIPVSWQVPGLPAKAELRTLDRVLALGGSTDMVAAVEMHQLPVRAVSAARRRQAVTKDDDGRDLIEQLVKDAEALRRNELTAALERCREYYNAAETRYLAGGCLSRFVQRYGDDPFAVEGFLLVGILRMDFALDYSAAEVSFQEFLSRAPDHPSAELAVYRLWLAATEDGRITTALERGRVYLRRYPNGRHVGKILQRFPELKAEL